MTGSTRYVYACGHSKVWPPAPRGVYDQEVRLESDCSGCETARVRRYRELRRLYGKARNVVRSRKYPGGAK